MCILFTSYWFYSCVREALLRRIGYNRVKRLSTRDLLDLQFVARRNFVESLETSDPTIKTVLDAYPCFKKAAHVCLYLLIYCIWKLHVGEK